jgi:internalin A
LGIVVNFRDDPRLSETHVLNPEWVTNGIYRILNAKSLTARQGELQRNELSSILDADQYPRSMHLYLLDLMRKFELCYEFYDNAGTYLVPELLGKEQLRSCSSSKPNDALRFESTDTTSFPKGCFHDS